MLSFERALRESLKECPGDVFQRVKSLKPTPEAFIVQFLSRTFLKISTENCPHLNTVPDTVVDTLGALNPTINEKYSQELRDLCFKAIGKYKKNHKDTLLYRAVVQVEQPNVELVQKLFKAGFKDNTVLINFVFREVVQQCINSKEKAEIVKIVLDYKKSIDPEDISKAIKANNLTLLNLYFNSHCKRKSIPADDIKMAIESNFVEVLKVCNVFDQNVKTNLLTINKKTQRCQFFDLAVTKSDIATIKYLLSVLEEKETKIIVYKNVIDERIIDIATTRVKNCENDDTRDIYNYLSRKLSILNNQKYFLKKLFQLDSDNIQNIHDILEKLCNMYKENKFLSKVFPEWNNSTNDLLQLFEENNIGLHREDAEYKVITLLKKLAILIGLLSTHDEGIQAKFSMIPWRELKRLPFVLTNDYHISEISFLDARKLLEQISPDLYKLKLRLGDLIKAYSKRGNPSFQKFININRKEHKDTKNTKRTQKDTKESIKLHNVFNLTKKSIDLEVINFTLDHVKILEQLNFSSVSDRCAFIQCLQNIGEKYNHFSGETLIFLQKFDLIKKLRDTIAHIWSRTGHTKKFLTLLERPDQSQDEIQGYFNDWRDFILTKYKKVLEKIKANYGDLQNVNLNRFLSDEESLKLRPLNLLGLLENVSPSPDVESSIPSTDSRVDRRMAIIKYVIIRINNLIQNVCHSKSYTQIRNALRAPEIHLKFTLILTIIGESIHSIKYEDDYLSVADFALFKELDFLKWVRNALMHLDNIDEKGTLIDYLSNDLLTEFSIATHGQKVIEFSKYFDYLCQQIHVFQKTLRTILKNGNFLQEYTGQDRLYLNFVFEKKNSHIQSTRNSLDCTKRLRPDLDINEFNIEMILTNKVKIQSEAKKLKVNVLGLFGKLPIRGFTGSGDLSGILVTIGDDSFLDKIAEFKQFVCNKLKYRLLVVEMRQLDEYLECKNVDRKEGDEYKQTFLETANKYSLDNLKNNMVLIRALAHDNVEQLLLNDFNFDTSQFASSDAPLQSAIEQFCKPAMDAAEKKASELRSVVDEEVSYSQDEALKGKTFDIGLFSELASNAVEEIVSDYEDRKVTGKNVNCCIIDVNKLCFDLSLVTYKKKSFTRNLTYSRRIFSGPVIHQLYDIYAKLCDKTFNGNILKITEEILSRGVELFGKQDREGIKKITNKLINVIYSAGGEVNNEEIEGKKSVLEKEIWSKGSDIYSKQNHSKIRDNILDFLKEIFDQEAHLAERQRSKKIKGNILRLVKEILDRGANVNITDPWWNETVLHKLCQEYDESLFTILAKNNHLNVNLHGSDRKVPLEIALLNDNSHLIEFLKDKTSYKDALLIAAVRAGNVEYIEYLIETCQRNVNKVSFNIRDEYGTPILHYAIFERDDDNNIRAYDEKYRKVIKLLVKNGAAITSFENKYPLMWSLKNNDTDLSLFFVDYASDLHDHTPQGGICPIHQAILNIKLFPEKRKEYIRIIQQIAVKSADVDAEIYHGSDTPLFLAAKQNDLEVIKVLICNGANINYKPYRISGITEVENSEKIIEFFIDNGMRGAYEYLDKYKYIFDFCSSKKFKELKQVIVAQSLSLNAVDSKGRNLLWYAIEERDAALIEWLSRKGAFLSLDLKFFRVDHDSGDGESYYDHLCAHANGSILHVLQGMGVVNWERFDGFDIEFICDNALKNDDLEAIQILEEHKYFDITTENLTSGKVRKYLTSYETVFSQIQERRNIQQLKNQIMELKNKSVLFDGLSLLHTAVSENHIDLINYLLNYVNILDANILSCGQKSALDWAVEERSKLDVIKILIGKKVRITSHFPIDSYLALCNEGIGSEEKYNIIFKYINDNSDFKNFLFKKAFDNKYLSNPKFYKLLLELCWDPNEYEKSSSLFNGGQTVLHKCAYRGHDDSIKVLCESGKLDFELPATTFIVFMTSGPVTAVGLALENGKFGTAKLLIENGASPYKYLLILLLSAFYEEDVVFANLLLSKSVVYDSEETRSYLDLWLKKSFNCWMICHAMCFLDNNRDKIIGMPDYIYNNLANLVR